MDKRFGAEAKLGIGGGGVVSEESQRKCAHDLSVQTASPLIFLSVSLQIAEDLYRNGKPDDAVPHLLTALEDRNNFDADIQLAYLIPDLWLSVQLLEFAEQRGFTAVFRLLFPNEFTSFI
jgi:hypothetical protein